MASKSDIPNVFKRISNLAKAAGKAVDHLVKTGKHKDPSLLDIRLPICNTCPMKLNDLCTECGCYLSEKALWITETCPLGKWPPVEMEKK